MSSNDIYKTCPVYENKRFLLRLIEKEDADNLLKVYSDKFALPFFNCDNCHGTTFYNETKKGMEECIYYWLLEYGRKGFVRFSIVDKPLRQCIGTIELFRRISTDYYTDCGLLRLDLRSDYETERDIEKILSCVLLHAYEDFSCQMVATKAAPYAIIRRSALTNLGFTLSEEPLIGEDGTKYTDYFIRMKD